MYDLLILLHKIKNTDIKFEILLDRWEETIHTNSTKSFSKTNGKERKDTHWMAGPSGGINPSQHAKSNNSPSTQTLKMIFNINDNSSPSEKTVMNSWPPLISRRLSNPDCAPALLRVLIIINFRQAVFGKNPFETRGTTAHSLPRCTSFAFQCHDRI